MIQEQQVVRNRIRLTKYVMEKICNDFTPQGIYFAKQRNILYRGEPQMFSDKKSRIKVYVISILIPLAVGALSALLTRSGMKEYAALSRPPLAPPGIVFPIAWAVLYVLMGISAAMIYNSTKNTERKKALWLYAIQLVVNFFWSLIFFGAGWRLFGLFWILLLLILVFLM